MAGRDVKRYQPLRANKYLIFARRDIKIKSYPAVLNHLEQYRTQLEPKPKDWKGEWEGRKPGSYLWYELQDAVDYYPEFEKPKIIYPNICKRPEFTFDREGMYTNQKCFIISLDDKFLLGYLNSALNYFLFRNILPKLRGDFFEPSYVFFKNFPVPKADKVKKAAIVSAAEKLQTGESGNDRSALGAEINRLVYGLYDLTEEEVGLIEENI